MQKDVQSYCVRWPHTDAATWDEFVKRRLSHDLWPHYGMLYSAAAGCVSCVKAYVDEGGDVWKGSKNNPNYNAWRASFQGQSLQTIHWQEALRAYLGTLPHAEALLRSSASHWKKEKLVCTFEELMREKHGGLAGHAPETSAANGSAAGHVMRGNMKKLHTFAYEGRTNLVADILQLHPELLWEVDADQLRAVDHARIGRYCNMPAMDAMQWLAMEEEKDLMHRVSKRYRCSAAA
jgi:hypothetical protein